MAKEKKFIDERVFKGKKVSDIFEDLYNDYDSTRKDIDEMNLYFFNTHKLEPGEMLEAMETIAKLMGIKTKLSDNMIKTLSVLQKSVASETKEVLSDEKEDELGELLKRIELSDN